MNDAATTSEAAAPDQRIDAEIKRLQDGIRDYLIKQWRIPDNCIDGAGCDSGDPLDFTNAEIGQALSFVTDKHDQRVAELEASVEKLREALTSSRRAIDHIRKVVSPHLVGADECARLDLALELIDAALSAASGGRSDGQ